jgi:hypothetical protein
VIGLRDSPVDTFVRGVFFLGPLWAIFFVARTSVPARSDQSLSPNPQAVS